MRTVTAGWIVVLLAMALGAAPGPADAQKRECREYGRITVRELAMVPDPLPAGQPVQRWIVTLGADRDGECETKIVVAAGVRERQRIVGAKVAWRLRPGINVISVPAHKVTGFSSQPLDNCLFVWADVPGDQHLTVALQSLRSFCARRIPPGSWTLR